MDVNICLIGNIINYIGFITHFLHVYEETWDNEAGLMSSMSQNQS